jgi:hypothetical protein
MQSRNQVPKLVPNCNHSASALILLRPPLDFVRGSTPLSVSQHLPNRRDPNLSPRSVFKREMPSISGLSTRPGFCFHGRKPMRTPHAQCPKFP